MLVALLARLHMNDVHPAVVNQAPKLSAATEDETSQYRVMLDRAFRFCNGLPSQQTTTDSGAEALTKCCQEMKESLTK